MKIIDTIVYQREVPKHHNVLWLYPLFDKNDKYELRIYNGYGWYDILSGTIKEIYEKLNELLQKSKEYTDEEILKLSSEIKLLINDLNEKTNDNSESIEKLENELEKVVENIDEKIKELPVYITLKGELENEQQLEELTDVKTGDAWLVKVENPEGEGYHYEEYIYTLNDRWLNVGEMNKLDNYYNKQYINELEETIYKKINNVSVKELPADIYRGQNYAISLLQRRNLREGDSLEIVYQYNHANGCPFSAMFSNNKLSLMLGNTSVKGEINFSNGKACGTKLNANPSSEGIVDLLLPKESGTLALDKEVTEETNGLMSSEDKKKLNNIPDIQEYSIPKGGIIMWSGNKNNIPEGWALCDGENGTPNLQGRFILGAGSQEDANGELIKTFEEEVGPNNYAQANGHILRGTGTVTLTARQSGIVSHKHSTSTGYNFIKSGVGTGYRASDYPNGKNVEKNEQSLSSYPIVGSNILTESGRDALDCHNNMPPFYVLAFIMKL